MYLENTKWAMISFAMTDLQVKNFANVLLLQNYKTLKLKLQSLCFNVKIIFLQQHFLLPVKKFEKQHQFYSTDSFQKRFKQ